jgi:hypothetical protein
MDRARCTAAIVCNAAPAHTQFVADTHDKHVLAHRAHAQHRGLAIDRDLENQHITTGGDGSVGLRGHRRHPKPVAHGHLPLIQIRSGVVDEPDQLLGPPSDQSLPELENAVLDERRGSPLRLASVE